MRNFCTTRSAYAELNNGCRRKRYLRYHALGRGLERRTLNWDLFTGSLVHAQLANLIQGLPIDEACPLGNAQELAKLTVDNYDQEQMDRHLALAEALTRCWANVRWPEVQEHFEILEVEQEHSFVLCEGLGWRVYFLAKPGDFLGRRKADGVLVPHEFKTCGLWGENYFESFQYSPQSIGHTWTTEQIYGEPCGFVQMEFLYKGKKNDGLIDTPLLQGVIDQCNPIAGTDHYRPIRKGDRNRQEMWKIMPVAEWIAQVPLAVQSEQLASRQIMRRQSDLERHIAQMEQQESDWAHAIDMLDCGLTSQEYFENGVCPGKFSEDCFCDRYQHKCGYTPLCWDGLTPEEALASGEFVVRKSHYELEEKLLRSTD